MAVPEYQTTHPRTRIQWRNWLKKNHASAKGIWMIYFKKETGHSRVFYDEAVEEALCFGWIDSLPRKLDMARAMLKFTPRKKGSTWSAINKTRVEKLIEAGLMQPAGLKKIEEARIDGSWESLNTSNFHTDTKTLPADLQKAFIRQKKALENFMGFATSHRRRFLFWIDSAKRPETRRARIRQTILMSKAGKKPGISGFVL